MITLPTNWPTIASLLIVAVGSVAGTAMSWGSLNTQVSDLRDQSAGQFSEMKRRSDIQDKALQVHTSQIAATHTDIAVVDTKVTDIKETVGRIEKKIDNLK